jgi:RHS repeat-associated protein
VTQNGCCLYCKCTFLRYAEPPEHTGKFVGGLFGFSYDALGRRTQMTRPNSITTNYQYNTLSRLLSVLHQAGSSTIDGASYTLDAAGNRTAKQDDLAGVTSNYTYDKIYELTQVTQGTNTTESYSFDPVGNRLSSLSTASYSYNSSNELTSNSNGSYTYDNNGNTLTDAAGKSYAWDFENRLKQVTLPNSGGMVSFLYDPFGRRVEKISPTTTSIFAYDGDNLVETVNASGGEVASYAQGPNIDEPLAMDRSGTIDYYEQDGLGSVTSLTASNGSVAQSYTYDSFGNQTASSGSLTNYFRYTGREFDKETNLYYYRARYYDPTTGRFLSEDPLRFGIGPTVRHSRSGWMSHLMTPSALHGHSADFYAYVTNSPTNGTDPRGLWQVTIAGGLDVGVLITFGHNDGEWNFGLDFGGAQGLFGSFDPDDVDCDCGLNAHAEGDLGTLFPELPELGDTGLGGDINFNQSNGPSYGLSLDDPALPGGFGQWTWDPAGPQPHPTFGIGAGIFAGAGYTWCF